MQTSVYYKIANAAWYQIVWFTALIGRETMEPLLLVLLGLHFVWSPRRKADLLLVIMCGSIGITADSLLGTAGVYVFSPTPTVLAIPFWLAAIWLSFCCTLLHSFNLFVSRPVLGPLIVAALAPLSYMAGQKLGAVSFGVPTKNAMLIIGLSWLLVMTVIGFITRQIDQAIPIELKTRTTDARVVN